MTDTMPRDFNRRLGIEHLGDWLRYGGDSAALRRLAGEDLPDRGSPQPVISPRLSHIIRPVPERDGEMIAPNLQSDGT
jgi:hypothetical protein